MGFQYELTKRSRHCSACGRSIKGAARILVYKFKFSYTPRFYYSAIREKTFNFCKNCSRSASTKLPIVIKRFVSRMRQAGFRSGGYVGPIQKPTKRSYKKQSLKANKDSKVNLLGLNYIFKQLCDPKARHEPKN